MSAILEKLYPKAKEIVEDKIVFVAPATGKFSKKNTDIYPPISGDDLSLSYIKERKPPKKVVIEYLRNRVDELLEDSD
jgi:hypothetical protein